MARCPRFVLALFLVNLMGTVTGFSSQSPVISNKPQPILNTVLPQQDPQRRPTTAAQPLHMVVTDRDPDLVEMMLGGERYEMVPLPDRMCDTTIFVGNLCEFVRDDDLSQLFRSVTNLQSVPAVVVRKVNMQSLRYGFVSFMTVEEKEAAILRFHGMEWRGKQIKVEAIRDDPSKSRVRVPERMVHYVSGRVKKTKSGRVNSMRNARGDDEAGKKKKKKKRLLSNQKKCALKRSGGNGSSASLRARLSTADQEELARACKKGFLTLDGRKAGHGSLANLCSSVALKGSKLAVAHRKWCDEKEKPNIILYKASGRSGGSVLVDHLVVDLSPLRNQGAAPHWKSDIFSAAASAGMELKVSEEAVECSTDGEIGGHSNGIEDTLAQVYSNPAEPQKSIERLPFVSYGFFVGDRSNAKAMARQLSTQWEIPEVEEEFQDSDQVAGSSQPKKKKGRYQNNQGKVGKVLSDSQGIRRAKRRSGKVRRDDWEKAVGKYMRY